MNKGKYFLFSFFRSYSRVEVDGNYIDVGEGRIAGELEGRREGVKIYREREIVFCVRKGFLLFVVSIDECKSIFSVFGDSRINVVRLRAYFFVVWRFVIWCLVAIYRVFFNYVVINK